MNLEQLAFDKATELFFSLQREAALEYQEKIKQAYKKAHELYMDSTNEKICQKCKT